MSDREIGRLSIHWLPFDEQTYGQVDIPGARINLNENNQFLSKCRGARNMDALLPIAAGMYVNSAIASDGIQRCFPFMSHDDPVEFIHLWARIASSIVEPNTMKPP